MLFAAVMMMAGIINKGFAQTTDTKSNSANAQILGAITLTAGQNLEFGGIVPDATGGDVVISSSDGRTTTSGVTLVSSKVTPKSAAFSLTGTGLVGYIITIPTASFNITNTTGTGNETMAVTAMTCSKTFIDAGHYSSTFLANGTDAFKVGGALTVGAGQIAGVYTGTFNVTVAY